MIGDRIRDARNGELPPSIGPTYACYRLKLRLAVKGSLGAQCKILKVYPGIDAGFADSGLSRTLD